MKRVASEHDYWHPGLPWNWALGSYLNGVAPSVFHGLRLCCIVLTPTVPPFPQQSKNTCAHNNTRKAHANGIKKAKKSKFVSKKGMDPKFLRNQKFAKKYNKSKRVKEDDDKDE
jgi:large subunit ribosomal protein L29e